MYRARHVCNMKCGQTLEMQIIGTEMGYCMNTTSMLTEEFWQVVEGFVEYPTNQQTENMIY